MSELLFYQTFGEEHLASSPNQPSVVLIHGLFGSGDNLSVIRRHFEASHHVISLDLPDHGKSPRSEHFSFDVGAQQVIETLSSLNVDKVMIVAHSLGGKIAMRVASLAPALIENLVVLDIAPVKYEPRHQNVINGLSSVKLDGLTDRKEALAQLSENVKDASTCAFLLKSLYQDETLGWRWRFNLPLIVRDYPLLSDWPFSGLLYSGKMTFIKGKKSDYISAHHQATINTQFPNAKAKIVDAGHWLHAEKPQLINTLLTRILLGADK
ncbi:alpha/beta fold hydrolase [Brumicola nitratireducens]|uniref:Putative esterase/lipase ybfF n=1 Tax=Glaciecola nitratireducens (strain JCM 12485 / KCTC 12276 / FR1064) TaxID=1085623 RepID=G4QKH6_GLANF|nr:alpha/beta fold hydrolase [Glaciecola nitratireducens]AEP30042.1 putative esterase/lipase ybfF [Glaciecola nitratireducens FR1064]